MNLLGLFKERWQKQFSQYSIANTKLLVAVSGGIDSVVLTDLIARFGFDFKIAHCNFKLRGEESERDEAFVRNIGLKYEKEVLVRCFDTEVYANENQLSIQVAARNLRYEWFGEVIESWKETTQSNCFIVTAHHADDNIETVAMNFFRGTGISGLKGIQPFVKEQRLIRPLLCFSKEELIKYAKENNLDFVEDSSNSSNKYTRNLFRNRILPMVKEVFLQVEGNMLANIERMNEVDILYREALETRLKKLVIQREKEWHIPINLLKKQTALYTLVWEIISSFGFNALQVKEVLKLTEANNGAYISSNNHRIIKNRLWLIIAPTYENKVQHFIIEKETTEVVFGHEKLDFKTIDIKHFKIEDDKQIASLDTNLLKYPLLLRKRKEGDYFYPLGMEKKKKVSRFLIDQKLSKTEKENIWVLESNKKIIWVVGLRLDNRFKITDSTKSVLKIAYSK